MGRRRKEKEEEEKYLRAVDLGWLSIPLLVMLLCGACSRGDNATRTPVPTFTPTPLGAAPASGEVAPAPATATNTVEVAMPSATMTDTPVPPTATSTPLPTDTPSPPPPATDTPVPTDTPTTTATPAPTATPSFTFDLVLAEKYPTTSLAPNVVRVFLYVADENDFGLPGYSLQVVHNGATLPVDKVSTGGLPGLTRGEPSPYTRFTNLTVIFVEAQAGTWDVQLVDSNGNPAGPPAQFNLTDNEDTRELYVKYQPRKGS